METNETDIQDIFIKSFYNGKPFEAEGTGIARLLIQITLILLLPRIIHYFLFQYLSQPRVVSEMVSGLLLGPSFFGKIPGWMPALFPDHSMPILKVLSMLGSTFFLFIVGLGIDLSIVLIEWRLIVGSVLLSACFSLLFSAPLMLIFATPDYTMGTLPELFLFVACLIGITATGLLARILSDRGILNKRLGAVAMATTAINAMYHSLLFASAMSMYGMSFTWIPPDPLPPGKTTPLDAGSRFDPIYILLLYLGFLLVLSFPVRWLWQRLALRAQAKHKLDMFTIWLVFFMLLLCSYITQAATLAARLGGFSFALFAIPRLGTFCQDLRRFFEGPIVLIFIPVFYGWTGIRVDFFLMSPTDVGVVFLLIFVSFVVKFAAMYMVACANGMTGFKGAYFGILNATKGFAGVILCNVALEIGFISRRFFAMVVLFAVLSTIVVTPTLRLLQFFEKHLKQRTGGDLTAPKSKQSLEYRILMIPSSPASAQCLVQLTGHFASLRPSHHQVAVTAMRCVSAEEMDDSFAAMYLESASFEELCHDPILSSTLAAWQGGNRQTTMTLRAVSLPDPLNDLLGYVHGEGMTGHSLNDGPTEETLFNASEQPFHGIVFDYEDSSTQVPFIQALLSASRVDAFITWNVSDFNVQRIFLLLGSTDIEQKSEPLTIALAGALASAQPNAAFLVWKHQIAAMNPMPRFEDNGFSPMPTPEPFDIEGNLVDAILALAAETTSHLDRSIIIAPIFFDSQRLSDESRFQFPGFKETHIFDVLMATNAQIIIVAQNYPLASFHDPNLFDPDIRINMPQKGQVSSQFYLDG